VVIAEPSLRISVAICTRNGAEYLATQLRSILAQTRLPNEIVLSDDASQDETVAIARAVFADIHGPTPDIRIIENAVALGVTGNFEQASLACSGNLIALSDQDDAWHPNRLELLERIFRDRPDLELLHGDAELVDEAGTSLGHTLFHALGVTSWEKRQIAQGRAFSVFLRRNLATGATMIFRRDLLSIASPFPGEWVHDEWLAIIASATGRVDVLADPLLDYRQHGSNQIGAQKLTLGGKFNRLREPRQARNQRLATNFGILLARLEQLGSQISQQDVRRAKGKLAHELVRLGLPESRLKRILPILREQARGSYRRYGRGVSDVLRDLLQPAN
jgi:glycosyltransferase involved in cell wall biosynthesis